VDVETVMVAFDPAGKGPVGVASTGVASATAATDPKVTSAVSTASAFRLPRSGERRNTDPSFKGVEVVG
jgi:hypothetical protein